jgi:hypothetical protein
MDFAEATSSSVEDGGVVQRRLRMALEPLRHFTPGLVDSFGHAWILARTAARRASRKAYFRLISKAGSDILPDEPGMLLSEGAADLYRNSNLTPHQLLVWLGQKLQPQAPIYNVTVAFPFEGRIDPEYFRLAFRKLVASSDALCTMIDELDGVPQQRNVEIDDYDLPYIDCSGHPDPERACAERMRALGAVPLDLSRRLFDSALFKTGSDSFVWYLNLHHIISDGVSVLLVYNHMADLYGRALAGTLDEVPAIPRFYEYVEDELKRERSAGRKDAEAYWRSKLGDGAEPIDIYGARVRNGTRVERLSIDLDSDRSAKLRSLAARPRLARGSSNLRIFLLIATALFAYLYRATRKSRLSIGIPFHNRARRRSKMLSD